MVARAALLDAPGQRDGALRRWVPRRVAGGGAAHRDQEGCGARGRHHRARPRQPPCGGEGWGHGPQSQAGQNVAADRKLSRSELDRRRHRWHLSPEAERNSQPAFFPTRDRIPFIQGLGQYRSRPARL